MLAVAALVEAVAFGARDPFGVGDPVALPNGVVDVQGATCGLPIDVHVVAANPPQPAVDCFPNRDLAGVRVGSRRGFLVRVAAVVQMRPLAGHGDGEAVVAVFKGDRAVHRVDVVVARPGDEDGVAILEARVMGPDIRLDDGEVVGGQLIASPDDDIGGRLLDDGKVDRRGNRVRGRPVVVLREALHGKVRIRVSGSDAEQRRRQSDEKRKSRVLDSAMHGDHP